VIDKWIVFAAILIVNTLLALALAALLSRTRTTAGRRELAISLILLAMWAFCYAMITLSTSLEAKRFWLKMENVGIVFQPVFWLLFTLNYIRRNQPIKLKWGLALSVIPIVTLTLLFSELWFSHYYSSVHIASPDGGPLVIERGKWYWAQLIQSYLLYIASTVILLRFFLKNRFIYRRRMGLLAAAVLTPWIVNLFYQAVLTFQPDFAIPIDFTPISFTVSAGLMGAGVFGFHLFDLLPIARDVVMEHIPEMVVVVDAHDRVLDANDVARKWLGKNEKEIVGQDPLDVFRAWPQLVNRFLSTHATHDEIQVGNPPRTLDLVVTPINNGSGILQGRVIVAHDVTERKDLENSLRTQLAVNESLRAQLQEQAIRDPLTGVFNRRFFAEALDKEVARAAREGNPFSVVILDLDWFKKFNDTYGHKCGDVMLQSFVNFLVKNTRGGDIVCRYGGEEFVILMPHTKPETAFERADAWRALYQSMPTDYLGQSLTATFSAGVAGYPAHGRDGEAILIVADQALYRSKENGRNRVTLYSPM
jgi:diguanylate cyclase (GGDEF)-like protein/PAS domain S-box-containing protein